MIRITADWVAGTDKNFKMMQDREVFNEFTHWYRNQQIFKTVINIEWNICGNIIGWPSILLIVKVNWFVSWLRKIDVGPSSLCIQLLYRLSKTCCNSLLTSNHQWKYTIKHSWLKHSPIVSSTCPLWYTFVSIDKIIWMPLLISLHCTVSHFTYIDLRCRALIIDQGNKSIWVMWALEKHRIIQSLH